MNSHKWILLTEDNPNDAELTVRAIMAKLPVAEITVAQDGQDALDCLHRRGIYGKRVVDDPILILLDLKMPKVDGMQVLEEIKSHATLKTIPVVIFTSSREESDIARAYKLGANAYVVKPLDFGQYAAALGTISSFWIELNEPPPAGTGDAHKRSLKTRSRGGRTPMPPLIAEYGKR